MWMGANGVFLVGRDRTRTKGDVGGDVGQNIMGLGYLNERALWKDKRKNLVRIFD